MYSTNRLVNNLIQINVVKQIIRNHRNLARNKKVIDPGIQRRKSLIDDDQEIEQLNDYDFDMEADFMNTGQSYGDHMKEVRLEHERKKYLIVKQKYFKEKSPNFLTWSDKEQIRYLYNTNPDEWTVEKLSEGFPALPEIIAKIIKSTWTKKTENQIQNHDKSVQQNWALFKEKKLNLQPEVAKHLNKFTDRKLNLKPIEVPEEMKGNKNMLAPNIKISTEFSEIIKSYERLKNKDSNMADKLFISNKSKVQKPPKEDTYILDGSNVIQNSKHTTLGHLQNKLLKKVQQGKEQADEKLILQELKDEKCIVKSEHQQLEEPSFKTTTSADKTMDLVQNKFTSISTTVKDTKNNNKFLEYPEKIIIPKDKLKRGYTYKLNDCYYDDDGEFLYRVPGMYK